MEASPTVEKLLASNPNDADLQRCRGFAVWGQSLVLKDPEARRQGRVRARNAFLRAKELGNSDPVMLGALERMPADGGAEVTFSKVPEADDAMRQGEFAFITGQYESAISLYQQALAADPKEYEAALFIGDMYFAMKKTLEAGQWYGRASEIDPDREVAYRYWGDALLTAGDVDAAADKFVEAIVAEPYTAMPWRFLVKWANRKGVKLANPAIEIPPGASGEAKQEKSKNAWELYGSTRAEWKNGRFQREYPKEATYRHSLQEESSALHAVALAAADDLKSGKLQSLDISLQNLVALDRADLVQAYILLARPDQGIAQDYSAYRSVHRDQLRRYLKEYVMSASAR